MIIKLKNPNFAILRFNKGSLNLKMDILKCPIRKNSPNIIFPKKNVRFYKYYFISIYGHKVKTSDF